MRISDDKATVWYEVDWTAPDILSRAQTSDAVAYLVGYFAPTDSGMGDLMTGASFSDLGRDGDRTSSIENLDQQHATRAATPFP